jgi:hypothetical protein
MNTLKVVLAVITCVFAGAAAAQEEAAKPLDPAVTHSARLIVEVGSALAPESPTAERHVGVLERIALYAYNGEFEQMESAWRQFLSEEGSELEAGGFDELVLWVLRRAFHDQVSDLRYYADAVRYYADLIDRAHAYIEEMRGNIAQAGDETITVTTTEFNTVYATGREPAALGSIRRLNRRGMEAEIERTEGIIVRVRTLAGDAVSRLEYVLARRPGVLENLVEADRRLRAAVAEMYPQESP